MCDCELIAGAAMGWEYLSLERFESLGMHSRVLLDYFDVYRFAIQIG
jgi:hypothetical protein